MGKTKRGHDDDDKYVYLLCECAKSHVLFIALVGVNFFFVSSSVALMSVDEQILTVELVR